MMGKWSDKTKHPHAWASDPDIGAAAQDSGWAGLTGNLALFEAVVANESEGDPNKMSETGCASLTQFHPQQQHMFDTSQWAERIQASFKKAAETKPFADGAHTPPQEFPSHHLTKVQLAERRKEWLADPRIAVIYSGYDLLDHNAHNLVLTLQGYNGGNVYAKIHNPDKSTRVGKDASEYPGKIAAYLYYHVLHDPNPEPYAQTLHQLLNDAARIGAYQRVYNDMISFSESGSLEANREIQWANLPSGGAPQMLPDARSKNDPAVKEALELGKDYVAATHHDHGKQAPEFKHLKFHHVQPSAPPAHDEAPVVVTVIAPRHHKTEHASPHDDHSAGRRGQASSPGGEPVVTGRGAQPPAQAPAAHRPTPAAAHMDHDKPAAVATLKPPVEQTEPPARKHPAPPPPKHYGDWKAHDWHDPDAPKAPPAAPLPELSGLSHSVKQLADFAVSADDDYRKTKDFNVAGYGGVYWTLTHDKENGADMVRAMQERLKAAQLYDGAVDGKFGPKTLAAYQQWEQSEVAVKASNVTADGQISGSEVALLLTSPAPTPGVKPAAPSAARPK